MNKNPNNTANEKIFCNVPWYKIHITAAGTYAPCCIMEKSSFKQTINDVDPIQWFHSDQANSIRYKMLQDQPLDQCYKCYYRENVGFESGRIRDNYKSFIFPGDNFQRSYEQSPWYIEFQNSKKQHGATDLKPRDYMISLGNECNLACKMCSPIYSSRVSSKYQSWNLLPDHLKVRNNWSSDDNNWRKFLEAIRSTPDIVRLAFIGGETLMNKRFFEIVDFLLAENLFDFTMHFVTNATIYNHSLVTKLKKFKKLYIEFSIESIHDNNHYIRQGSDTKQVMQNILKFKKELADNSNFTISSAPQALSINTYDELILWALDNQLPIQGHLVTEPRYLNVTTLPEKIRHSFLPKFQSLEQNLQQQCDDQTSINFGSDPSRIHYLLLNETRTMINLLQQPEPENVKELQHQMIQWMMRWDRELNLDARKFFPEYQEWFKEMGYDV